MSIRSSEQNYKIAKALYHDISDDFYEIENNSEEDDGYVLDNIIETIKRLNRHINRINITELENEYDNKVINIIEDNIDAFREASYFIERSVMSMKLFDKLHPVLNTYINSIDWKKIASSKDEAMAKFARFLTDEDNYEQYRTIIANIVKGTLKKKAFGDFYRSISNRLSKPKVSKHPVRDPLPPEMWPEKERKEWEEYEKKRKEGGIPDDITKFDALGEKFMSLKNFTRLVESKKIK